jgi:hypothetical protein
VSRYSTTSNTSPATGTLFNPITCSDAYKNNKKILIEDNF